MFILLANFFKKKTLFSSLTKGSFVSCLIGEHYARVNYIYKRGHFCLCEGLNCLFTSRVRILNNAEPLNLDPKPLFRTFAAIEDIRTVLFALVAIKLFTISIVQSYNEVRISQIYNTISTIFAIGY